MATASAFRPGCEIDAIVIGASAGGVEALTALLPALPGGLSAAVIVVLHLPRERRSLLPEIFGPKCALAVTEADDKMPLRPGGIYFAPSDYHVLVERGPSIALSVDDPVHYSRPSIDVLFESAADIYGPRTMGVILTGGNEDGAAGLLAIHNAGGVTLVQDPDGAYAPYMPEAALKRVTPDFTLKLEQMADLFRTLDGAHLPGDAAVPLSGSPARGELGAARPRGQS